MFSVRSFILQAIYPALCRQCFFVIAQDSVFCDLCLATIKPVVSTYLPLSKTKKLKVLSVSAYILPVRTLVVRKFSGDVYASHQLADLIAQFTPLKNQKIDYLIPVPLHWTRYATRGFNQANVIARVLSKKFNVPVSRAVRRNIKTAFQWQQSAQMRRENVKNAFDFSLWYRWHGIDCFANKHIVIVDDLCTTGATLMAVAKVLLQANPASLTAVVGCRTI